jgi:DNA-binding transcriptional MerR regulator
MGAEEIPDKQYFKIGEVSALSQLEPYVLRYWETEFKMIRPVRFGSNQRMYRRKDVELIFEIKKLLYEEGFTIAGARKKLQQSAKEEKEKKPLPAPAPEPVQKVQNFEPLLREVRQELTDLLQFLNK